MNRIKLIEAANLKGNSFRHSITTSVTAIVGPNGEGKTSMLDALELALTGQLSWLRGSTNKPLRQPREIYDAVATGSSLSARVQLTDDTEYHFGATKRGDSVKGEGVTMDLTPVMLDPLEYLALSEPDRVKFLFARAALKELDAQKLSLTVVANTKNIKFEANTEQTEAALRELVDFVTKQKVEGTPQDYVAKLLESAKKRANEFQSVVQRLEKTGQGLTQVSGEPPRSDAEQVLAKRRAELEEAQRRATTAHGEVTRLQNLVAAAQAAHGKLANVASVLKQKDELEAEIAALRSESQQPAVDVVTPQNALVTASKEVARLEAAHNLAGQNVVACDQRIKTLEGLAAGYNVPTLEEAARRGSLVTELADLQRDVAEWQEPQAAEVSVFRTKLEHAKEELKKANDHWDVQNEVIKSFDSLSCCPTCKGSTVGWKDIVLAGMRSKLEELNAVGIEANKAFVEAELQVNKAISKQIENEKAIAAHKDRIARIKTLEAELAFIAAEDQKSIEAKRAADELPEARAKREQAATVLNDALDALNKALEAENAADNALNDARDKANALASVQTKLTLALGRKNDLEKQLSEFAVAESVAAELPKLQVTLTQALNEYTARDHDVGTIRNLVSAAETEVRKLVAWRGEQAAKARASEEKLKAEADRHCAKQLAAMIEELQSELVKQTIGLIVDRMNEVFSVCGERLEIRDNVLGAVGDSGFYAFRSFCGSKRALAMCAASVALSQDSPFKLAVVDEATRLDAESKVKLVECLLSLVASGKVDQCFVVDTDAAPYSVVTDENFSVLRV